MKAYHGGEINGATWYTTDEDHARTFGQVTSVEIDLEFARVLETDASVAFDGLFGYEADAALWAFIDSQDVRPSVVALSHWEGSGICYVVLESWRVSEAE